MNEFLPPPSPSHPQGVAPDGMPFKFQATVAMVQGVLTYTEYGELQHLASQNVHTRFVFQVHTISLPLSKSITPPSQACTT